MTILITGSCGLIGGEAVRYYLSRGYKVIGIDDDSRSKFFGKQASTLDRLNEFKCLNNYHHVFRNITNYEALSHELKNIKDIDLIIHTAAQPSHDWAATKPFDDFNTNALGTLNLLEIYRTRYPEAVFVHMSTNKVYGDTPNYLEYNETDTRYVPKDPEIARYGISEKMSIDQCKHSLFGVSKLYSDIIVQEYGRYFGLKTGVFRGGCLTGKTHAGVKIHGFLSYLAKCATNGDHYIINGYKGKQVRDNIHSSDVISAIDAFYKKPNIGAVYNLGGSIYSNCSILEAIEILEGLLDKKMKFSIVDAPREGDHIWYISDMRKFRQDYPDWSWSYTIYDILKEMVC